MLTGQQKLRLIQEIAEGTRPYRELAEEYGFTSESVVAQFKMRNKEAIARAKQGFEQRMEDLWVADKRARIATYEESIESLSQLVDELEPEKRPNAHKIIHNALRNVAEELGQLAPKEVPVAGQLTVRLEGVDTEAV